MLELFSGPFASSKASDQFQKGDHFLLKPFVDVLCPLVRAWKEDDHKSVIDILLNMSPDFKTGKFQKKISLKGMIGIAEESMTSLVNVWENGTIKKILKFALDQGLFQASLRLEEHLAREPRVEKYSEELFSKDRSDWLTDSFFNMPSDEIFNYQKYVKDQTPYSSQHGSKGEEYENVLVVLDDVEANWTQYNFVKLLAPSTHGAPSSDAMVQRARKLAYVCFSRAMKNLGIILFTTQPEQTKLELVEQGVFEENQVRIMN